MSDARGDLGRAARRPRVRVCAIFGVVLLVLAGGGAAGYYWYQNRPGKVEITTVPADSAILVDNVKVADKSPYRLERPPGAFSVSVVKAGYGRNDQNLVVRAGQSSTLSIALEPAADTGFELTSVPPGGLVWLDGIPMSWPRRPGAHGFSRLQDPSRQACAGDQGRSEAAAVARRGPDRAGDHQEGEGHAGDGGRGAEALGANPTPPPPSGGPRGRSFQG